ncbi:MAG: hypothetical protein OEY85_05070, partial [Rhodospirillales bacterium]|nr:hypothetical protein [Rhodospirillales bacterium]
ILWPQFHSGTVGHIHALQVQFWQTERWPPERLLQAQLTQIQALISHAANTVPFYQDRLKDVATLPPGKLTLEAFRRLPLLTRTEIQDAGESLVTQALPPGHGSMSDIKTSGSSGRPVRIKSSSLAGKFVAARGLRYNLWHRRDFLGKNVTMISLPPGTEEKKSQSWAVGIKTGPSVILNHNFPAAKLLEALIREDPDYLQIHPSTLRELLRISRETGLRPRKLREVRTLGDNLDGDIRDLCRREWNIGISDNYSCQELGIIALQCPDSPDQPRMHVMGECLLVEVLNDEGKACKAGEMGRIVATDLHNYATPLIRYELGDYAEAGPPCGCGRTLPVLSQIAGRERNLAILPNGDKVTPLLAMEPLIVELPIRQYQMIQKSLTEVEVKMTTSRPLTEEEENKFRNFIGRCLHYPFNCRFDYVDEIPRGPGGKFEIFRCEVASS